MNPKLRGILQHYIDISMIANRQPDKVPPYPRKDDHAVLFGVRQLNVGATRTGKSVNLALRAHDYRNIRVPAMPPDIPRGFVGFKVVSIDLSEKLDLAMLATPMEPDHPLYDVAMSTGRRPVGHDVKIYYPLIQLPQIYPFRLNNVPACVKFYTLNINDLDYNDFNDLFNLTPSQNAVMQYALRDRTVDYGPSDVLAKVYESINTGRVDFQPKFVKFEGEEMGEVVDGVETLTYSKNVINPLSAKSIILKLQSMIQLGLLMPCSHKGQPVDLNLDMPRILANRSEISIFAIPHGIPYNWRYMIAHYILKKIYLSQMRTKVPVHISIPEVSEFAPKTIDPDMPYVRRLRDMLILMCSQGASWWINFGFDTQFLNRTVWDKLNINEYFIYKMTDMSAITDSGGLLDSANIPPEYRDLIVYKLLPRVNGVGRCLHIPIDNLQKPDIYDNVVPPCHITSQPIWEVWKTKHSGEYYDATPLFNLASEILKDNFNRAISAIREIDDRNRAQKLKKAEREKEFYRRVLEACDKAESNMVKHSYLAKELASGCGCSLDWANEMIKTRLLNRELAEKRYIADPKGLQTVWLSIRRKEIEEELENIDKVIRDGDQDG